MVLKNNIIYYITNQKMESIKNSETYALASGSLNFEDTRTDNEIARDKLLAMEIPKKKRPVGRPKKPESEKAQQKIYYTRCEICQCEFQSKGPNSNYVKRHNESNKHIRNTEKQQNQN